MLRRLLTAVAAFVLLAPAGCGADRPEAGRHDPIVFVHGLGGSPAVWRTMAARFAADGWAPRDLHLWAYDSHRSNLRTARRLRDEVDRVLAASGAAKVDLITHSMGALSSRAYLGELGGTAHVDQWVSLGGPNHGLERALCPEISCREMLAGSRFLARLNRGDETPGPIAYATWWSPCDAVIDPDASASLRGARNTRTACLSHGALATDDSVYRQVRDFVAP